MKHYSSSKLFFSHECSKHGAQNPTTFKDIFYHFLLKMFLRVYNVCYLKETACYFTVFTGLFSCCKDLYQELQQMSFYLLI